MLMLLWEDVIQLIVLLIFTVLNYFTVHEGRVLYSPYVPASNIYNNVTAAKDACSHLQNCTGVVVVGEHNIVQSGTELYNSRNRTVKTLIKSGMWNM